jgi:hypothetical protein
MTIFQATVTIVSALVATQLGILFFMINRTDNVTRDLRGESQKMASELRGEIQNLTRELRTEMRELGTKLDTHNLAHLKGDVS